METFVRDFLEGTAAIVRSDHDTLLKMAQAATIAATAATDLAAAVKGDHDLLIRLTQMVTGDETGLISISKDHERRLRWVELRLYMAVGALALIELGIGLLTLLKH